MTKFAVKNPVTVLVLAVILILAGLSAYLRMPRESFPEIKIPLIFVTVVYPGASPEDMEKLVTEKIEDKLEGVDGLKKVSSTSGEGYSTVQVEFNADVEVETALRRVKDKVDEAKPDFPELQMRWMPEASTRLASLLTSEIHVTQLPQDLMPQAEAKGFKVSRGNVSAQRTLLGYLGVNLKDPKGLQLVRTWRRRPTCSWRISRRARSSGWGWGRM